MTRKYDAITDAFERGRLAERARLKSIVHEAIDAITDVLDTLDGRPETQREILEDLRRENIWRRY